MQLEICQYNTIINLNIKKCLLKIIKKKHLKILFAHWDVDQGFFIHGLILSIDNIYISQ